MSKNYDQDWSRIDRERRPLHYQVRLSPEMGDKVNSFQRKHRIKSRNETLRQILEIFFKRFHD